MNKEKMDYSEAYNEFWSRVDRMGSESYLDRNELVDQIISTVGYGRVLDVGCGEGRLVRALVERGVDAYGVDVSSVAVARGNQFCPERFQCSSVIDLPYADKYFDAIISTDCLEHIHPNDVPKAIAELRRVCKQYAFFTIATTNDRDDHWHLTVKPREWWEERFFEAGFIRHPEYYKINSLETISSSPWQITVPLSTIQGPLATRAGIFRYLNDTSEFSDVMLSSYTEIAGLPRAGDIAFHIGASSVDLAYVLSSNAECSEIHIFVDRSFTSENLPSDLNSANIFIHGLEKIPEKFLEYSGKVGFLFVDPEFKEDVELLSLHKIVTPGGRVVLASIVAEVSIEDFSARLGDGFRVEDVRNFKYQSKNFSFGIFLSSFCGGGKEFFPGIHGYISPPENLVNFSRDYSNPWLAQNLVVSGVRTSNKEILISEADLILSCEGLEATPDFGAALCVKGYRFLEGDFPESDVVHFIRRIDVYINSIHAENCSAHTLRWVISLGYLKAKLYLKVGDLESALASFRFVTENDALGFSPTLMTKIVSSYIIIGDIHLGYKRYEEAAVAYEKGALSGFEALKAPIAEWVGEWALPIKGAMYEATQIADFTNICILKLRALKISSKHRYPVLRVFQESNQSVFSINEKRYAIIEKQNSRLAEFSSAIDAQARMLEERWTIMQSMEAMIRDRDEALAGQGRMLEERWSIMQSMESMISEQYEIIKGEKTLIEKKLTITELIKALKYAIISSLRYRLSKKFGKKQ